MKKTKLEKLNISTSKLGFGAMRFPKKGDEIDQEQVNEMVKYAFDNGINYFDTAYVYGKDGASEKALGKALKQLKREDFFLADKMPLFDIKAENFLETTFNTTLKRLDTDYVDFYLMHALDKEKVANMKTIKAIDWAIQKKKEGKIKYIGFSIHDDVETLLDILSLYDWDFAQIQFNYMDIDDAPGEKGYDELAKRNIPIIIMEPLKGGILSDIPDKIAKPFRDLGGSNVTYAFKWLAQKTAIATILSGMSNMEQLKQNIEVFNDIKPLSDEEEKAIEMVKKNIVDSQKIGCTGCSYCMPCPAKVNIPELFKSWNVQAMGPSANWINGADIDVDNAKLCVGCGLCATKCPQHFDIPAKIRQLIAEQK
ncbi:MAG: aldo/keto reductase [Oscillospiraceae bacterium]